MLKRSSLTITWDVFESASIIRRHTGAPCLTITWDVFELDYEAANGTGYQV